MSSINSFENEPVREGLRAPVVVNENRSKWGPALGIGACGGRSISFFQYSQVKDLRPELNSRQKERRDAGAGNSDQ